MAPHEQGHVSPFAGGGIVGIRDLGDPDPSVGSAIRETIDRITAKVREEVEGLEYVAWSAGMHLHAIPIESAMFSMDMKPGLDEDRVTITIRQQYRVCGVDHPKEEVAAGGA
jgi:hypothetical protein